MLVGAQLELGQAAVELAVAEAGALRRRVFVRDHAQARQQLADAVVLEHHHPYRVLHGTEEWRRCRPISRHRFVQLLDVRKEDLLFLEHVRQHVIRELAHE
ncbi:hypothetical protein D3C83_94420 [compost metagenome]